MAIINIITLFIMPKNLTQIYSQQLIEAVIHEDLPLIKKMIDHGAELITQKVDEADAIYIALDLNHLDTLDYMLKCYTEKCQFSEYKNLTTFVFEDYFSVIFKNDNVKALSIFDKYGMLDLVLRFRQEEYSMKNMIQVGATQCILYSYDKLHEIDFIKYLTEKIRADLVVSSHENVFLGKDEHQQFVSSLKELNPEGFQIALISAVCSMKKSMYIEMPDRASFLHLMTNYFKVGLNPHQKMSEMVFPELSEERKEQLNTYSRNFLNQCVNNYTKAKSMTPDDTFMDLIYYDETKKSIEIVIEKNLLETSLQEPIKKTEKILKI